MQRKRIVNGQSFFVYTFSIIIESLQYGFANK